MPTFTAGRRAIRDRSKVLRELSEELRGRRAAVDAEIRKLQQKCPHPAAKGGCARGMTWWECPDCGESR